ncbi:hypothetical protein [Pseudogulbenkiania sp. MAI-1]|uniref:hypothetical protein n=1 Tax=Pseudogulbenkiania sp. MAI-1 TaxID=990370 RepID=UPI0012EBEEC7|nr:hypothetical protein [Pseudogulbenkiania sp. MAI-1]
MTRVPYMAYADHHIVERPACQRCQGTGERWSNTREEMVSCVSCCGTGYVITSAYPADQFESDGGEL